jgi:hypothetical protein
MKVLELLRP